MGSRNRGGAPPAGGLAARIRAFLVDSEGPVSSRELARRFLRVGSASEPVLVSLLQPLLRHAGARYRPGEGWTAGIASAPPPDGPAARSPGEPAEAPGAAAKEEAGPEGAEVPGAPGRGRQVACAVELDRQRIRRVCLVEMESLPGQGGEPPGPLMPGRKLGGRAWQRISAMLAGAESFVLRPAVEAAPLRLALASRGLPGPARIRSLSSAARGAARIRRGASPEEIAAALGVPWMEGDDAATAAENIASCLAAAAARAGEVEPAEAKPRPRFLTPELLESLPATPGTYRFLDAAGSTLYVGKAANLRRRLASYAAEGAGGKRRRPVAGLLQEVDRVEVREAGSDLQAILEEDAEIVRRSPRANVQREVRERRRRYAPGGCRALLLPGGGRGAVTVIFLRHGLYQGRCRLGPRGGGRRCALQILRRLMSAGETPAPRRARAAEIARGTQLVNSWLARRREHAQLDVDAFHTAEAALERLMSAARDLGSGESGPVLHR